MYACVDVHYSETRTVAACVVFEAWTDADAVDEVVHIGPPSSTYKPGEFYKRELPAVVLVLDQLSRPATTIIVDGYVWLGEGRKGMGAYVHEAMGVPVVGVAKRPFQGATPIEVLRGSSKRALLVTAVGIDSERAAKFVESMHGPHRLPTLLKRVDRLCRQVAKARG